MYMENIEFVHHRLDTPDIFTINGLFEYLILKTGDMYRCYRVYDPHYSSRYFIALLSGEMPNPKCECYIPTEFSFRPYGSYNYESQTIVGSKRLYCLIEITKEQYDFVNAPIVCLNIIKDKLDKTTPDARDGKMFYISSTTIRDIISVNKKFESTYIYKKLKNIVDKVNCEIHTNKNNDKSKNYDIEELKDLIITTINTEIKSINDKLNRLLQIAERYDPLNPIPCECKLEHPDKIAEPPLSITPSSICDLESGDVAISGTSSDINGLNYDSITATFTTGTFPTGISKFIGDE